MKQTLKSVLLGAGTLVVGGVMVASGTGRASAQTTPATGSPQPTTTTGGGEHQKPLSIYWMRYQFDVLLREHASLTVQALKAEHLNQPDAPAIMKAVDKNNRALAKTVDRAYPGTHDEFLALWQAHIGYYHDYLKAAEDHSEDGKQIAKKNLAECADKLSNLLSKKSDRLDEDALRHHLGTHGNQVMTIADHLVAGNYEAVHAIGRQAYRHMGNIAHVLAHGMPKPRW